MTQIDTDAIKKQLKTELESKSIDFDRIYTLTNDLIKTDANNIRFSVDARLIHRLGYELVGRQETALGELIKNAYDADATCVIVNYQNFQSAGGTLVISDNGIGMTEETIRSSWMRLATAEKIINPLSVVYGRSRAGKKGIGRLAVERLGERLVMKSCVAGLDQGCSITFDWDTSLKMGDDLGSIKFKIEKFSKDLQQQGTELQIDVLRDRWTEKMLAKVWSSVVLLQSPFKPVMSTAEVHKGVVTDPGFQVEINGTKSVDVAKKLSIDSAFLDHRLAKISGTIDSEGGVKYSLKCELLGLDESMSPSEPLLLVGETSFDVNYFIYLPNLLSGFTLRTAIAFGEKFGGIRVYRNGFRVLPYAEKGNDWLKLSDDTGRRNLLNPANNPNFFGHVNLDIELNPLLEETSSREGLIENETYEELVVFIRQGLEWAVQRIASVRLKKTSAGQKDWISKKTKPSEVLEKIVNDVQDAATQSSVEIPILSGEEIESPSDSNFPESGNDDNIIVSRAALKTVLNEQRKFEASVEVQEAAHIKYEEMLRILASLGISISVFSHEIGGAMTAVDAALTTFTQSAACGDSNNSSALKNLDSNMQRLRDLSGYINSIIGHAGSREKHQVPVSAALSTFVNEFKNYLNARNIEFSHEVEPSYLRTIEMHRSEIDSVLFNLLTNSVKAIGRSKTTNRAIKISAKRRGNYVVIRFQDTGDGIPMQNRDKIFDAFYTTGMFNPDEPAGTGTGLGLKIVSDIASANGGSISIAEPDEGLNCCFEFSIPIAKNQTEETKNA
jgi:signal transduction histidine kinase